MLTLFLFRPYHPLASKDLASGQVPSTRDRIRFPVLIEPLVQPLVLVDDWHLAWVQEKQQECDRDEAILASEVSIDSNERIVGRTKSAVSTAGQARCSWEISNSWAGGIAGLPR